MAQRYEIKMAFTYKNGTVGGLLQTTVYGKKAIERQIEANRQWLAIKGHVETSNEVKEVK